MPRVILRRDGHRSRGDSKIMGPVVLHKESPVAPHHLQDLLPTLRRPLGAGGVGEVGLGIKHPRTRLLEGAGQLPRFGAVRTTGHGNHADAGLRGSKQRAPITGRLDQQRLAMPHQPAENRAESALAAGKHDDVARLGRRNANRR